MTDSLPKSEAEEKAKAEGSTTIPEDRAFIIKRPGNINYASDRGSYPGCKIQEFANTDEINKFFTEHANLLVVSIEPASMPSRIYVTYTNQLSDQDLEDFTEFQREWSMHKQVREQEKAELQAKQAKARTDAEAEVRRLTQLGKRCENDHAGLSKRIDELEKKLKEARKGKS